MLRVYSFYSKQELRIQAEIEMNRTRATRLLIIYKRLTRSATPAAACYMLFHIIYSNLYIPLLVILNTYRVSSNKTHFAQAEMCFAFVVFMLLLLLLLLMLALAN